MSVSGSRVIFTEADDHDRRREESAWMLDAIVGAIVAGKLPPDDACAWAKIAAYEVEMLGLTPDPSLSIAN